MIPGKYGNRSRSFITIQMQWTKTMLFKSLFTWTWSVIRAEFATTKWLCLWTKHIHFNNCIYILQWVFVAPLFLLFTENNAIYRDPCWSWENSTTWFRRSFNCRFGIRLFLKSSSRRLRPVTSLERLALELSSSIH